MKCTLTSDHVMLRNAKQAALVRDSCCESERLMRELRGVVSERVRFCFNA